MANGAPNYLPGFEPENIKPLLATLLNDLDASFPDKTVVWSEWNHEKWDKAAGFLCKNLGYSRGTEFLEAYGYSIVQNREDIVTTRNEIPLEEKQPDSHKTSNKKQPAKRKNSIKNNRVDGETERINDYGKNGEPKKKRRTWLWILGWICIFPLPLTILLLRNKKMKPVLKYAIIAITWLMYLLLGLSINSSSRDNVSMQVSTPAATQFETRKTLYSDAQIVDLMNGFGTAKVGTMSVARADKADCTDEALADWYFNYVQKNTDCNYHVIVYNDVAGKGVYANKGFIQKDIALTGESNGTYSLGNDDGSTYYTVNEENKTITVRMVMADESVVENAKMKIDAVIPAEYKNGKTYSVDVAGPEGDLDCNLTLINSDFATMDCQSAAIDIASKVKALDLGIGYFCISFQEDDYKMNAISNLDNLTSQEASEISTKIY